MGEFNAEIRRHSQLKRKLLSAAENYRDVATFALNKLLSQVTVKSEDKVTCDESFASYDQMLEKYKIELDKIRISGKGEVFYSDKVYKTKKEVRAFVTIHIETLSWIIHNAFGDFEKVNAAHQEYIEFWNDFILVMAN